MASYEDTVLADTPNVYLRMDETGGDFNGATFVDTSGNGLDATEYYSTPGFGFPPPTDQARGWPSPIETDAASRAFEAWTNVAPYGPDGFVRLFVPDDALLKPAGDWTVEGWIMAKAPLASAGPRTLIGTENIGIEFNFSTSTRFGGYCVDSVGTKFTVSDLSFAVDDYIGVWFYVVVMRVANALVLYINGTLRATTIITSGLPTRQDAGDFTVHRGGLVFLWARYDEAALYDHALNSTRILAHYEAALNSLSLIGRSNVISTASLDGHELISPVSFPFRHNWSDAFNERLIFQTNITKSENWTEEGVAVRIAPRREIELSVLLRDDSERRDLRSKLWGQQDNVWFVPILNDIEQIQVDITSGSTTIPASTPYRDYEVGSYVGLRQINGSGKIIKSETVQIIAINTDSVELLTPLENSYSAFVSFIYPVRRGLVDDVIDLKGHADAIEETNLTFRLLAQDEEVVPNRITPWVISQTRRGFEVFDPAVWQANNWDENREYTLERGLALVDYQTGIFSVDSNTEGASEVFTYRMLLKGRDKIAALLGWLYARKGSLNYLWVPSMQRDVEVLGVSGNVLQTSGTSFADDYLPVRQDIAFIYNNNTFLTRRVVRSDGISPNETLELDGAVPSLINLRSVSLMKFCRIDADQFELAWITNDVLQVQWRFRELLSIPEGYGTHSASPSHSESPSVSPSGSASPSKSPSHSESLSQSPSHSVSPSSSSSASLSPSASTSPSSSDSPSPSSSASPSVSPSASTSPSLSTSPSSSSSPSTSPSHSASPSGSEPSAVSNLELWLKADAIAQSNDTEVSTWSDSSGNGRNATGVVGATKKPRLRTSQGPNSTAAVVMYDEPSGDNLGGYFTLPNFLTGFTAGNVFAVVSLQAEPGSLSHSAPACGDWGSAGDEYYPFGSGGNIYDSFGVNAREDAIVPGGSLVGWRVVEIRVAAGTNGYKYLLDGTQKRQATKTVAWNTSPTLGHSVTNTKRLRGWIAEIIFYSRVLDDTTERKAVIHAYLNSKYGFSLPT